MGKNSQKTTAECTQHTPEILSEVLVFIFIFLPSFSGQNEEREKFTARERTGDSTHSQGFNQYG